MQIKLIIPFLLLVIISFSGCKKDNTIQNQPPTIDFLNPLPSLVFVSTHDTLNIIAHATDKDGEIKEVEFFKDDILFSVDSEYPWNQQLTFDKEGNIDISIIALDNNQQYSDTATLSVVVVDVDKADINFSISPDYKKENNPITIQVNSVSPNSTIETTKLYINDKLTAQENNASLNFYIESATIGDYHVYAVVKDKNGKTTTSATHSFIVKTNKPPQIELVFFNPNNLIPGSSLSVQLDVNDPDGDIDSVSYFLNDSLIANLVSDYSSCYLTLPYSGTYSLHATAFDSDGASASTPDSTFTVQEGFLSNGLITNIIASTNNNVFYALNRGENLLMIQEPYSNNNKSIELPYAKPIDMDYSPSEEMLFIIYKYQGVVTSWDQNTQEFKTITFSNTANSLKIKSDVIHRRFYVTTDQGLFIINIDNGEVLNVNNSVEIEDFVVDSKNQFLITTYDNHYLNINKYSVNHDSLNFLQSRTETKSYNHNLVINKQKEYFLVVTNIGNDNNGNHYAFNTNNINELYGQYDNPEHQSYATFTNDGNSIISISDSDNMLYIINAESFQLEKEMSLRDASNAIVAVNDFKDKAAVFSHNTYQTDYKMLYYKIE